MQIKYLLLFPAGKNVRVKGQAVPENIPKGPYFLDIDIDINELGEEKYQIEGENVVQKGYVYDKSVYLFECTYELGEALGDGLSIKKQQMNTAIRARLVDSLHPDKSLVEEYTVMLMDKATKIKEFVTKNTYSLARFMRSVEKKISLKEAEEIMVSRVSYSDDDLSIIDWEGAVLFDRQADFEAQIELLKIGNYQLLRYRILDNMIEKSLRAIRGAVESPRRNIIGNNFIKTAVENKLSILLDFDRVDQSLLLVGDWYSAKFFKVVKDEFYLDDWKDLVKDKIENLETIDSAVRDNLVFSWRRFLDLIQIVGWLVLLIGYFVLYLKDASLF